MWRAKPPPGQPREAWDRGRIFVTLVNRLGLQPAGERIAGALHLDLCQRGWTYGPISLAEIGFLAHVTPTTAGRQLCKLNELGVLVYEPGCRRRQGIVRLVSKETLERMLAERIADGPDLRARVFGRKLGSPCASFRPENPTAARELPAGKHDPSARVLERQTRALRASSRAPNPRAARE